MVIVATNGNLILVEFPLTESVPPMLHYAVREDIVAAMKGEEYITWATVPTRYICKLLHNSGDKVVAVYERESVTK